MAIYKPVSSVARRALGVGGSVLNGIIGNTVGKIGEKLGVGGSLLNEAGGFVSSAVTSYATSKLMKPVAKLDDYVNQSIRKGLKVFGLNAFDNEKRNGETIHYTGNLSVSQLLENYQATNADRLSRKNFFLLEVNDKSGYAPTSNGERLSMFNLFCTDLSFQSFDIQGEAVQVGSIELDKLGSSARTSMTLNVYDDEVGTIKRWVEQKALLSASSDGTFMPPSYYVFDVRVVFGTNLALENYYEQLFTMRVQTMPHELSRNEHGLEELQLTFVQVDTCMPNWIR